MVTRYVAIGILAGLLTSTGARAQTSPTPANKQAQADALYRNAWQAANERNYDKACPMFDAVLALAPDYQKAAIAAAQCYTEAGKYVTAVDRYQTAAAVAANQAVQNSQMLELIRAGKESATAKISYVTIYVPGPVGSIPGISITLNGDVIDPADYGTKISLDRGKYQIRATAPNRIPSKIEFEITGDAHDFHRTLVPLEMAPQTTNELDPVSPVPNSANPEPAKKDTKTPNTIQQPTPVLANAENTRLTTTDPEKKSSKAVAGRNENGSSIGGGVALVLLGGGLITGASFLAAKTATIPSSNADYPMYFGVSAAGFLMGTFGVIGGLTLALPSRKHEQKTGHSLQAPAIFVAPNQVTFQARW